MDMAKADYHIKYMETEPIQAGLPTAPSRDLINVETYDDYLMMVSPQVHQNIFALEKLQTSFRTKRLETFQKTHTLQRRFHGVAYQLENKLHELSKKIPCYWGRILNISDLNYNNLADANALKYLSDVVVESVPLVSSTLADKTPCLLALYRVHFIFEPNPLMQNTEGIKSVYFKVCGYNNPDMEMLEPEEETDQPILWNPGKDPRVSRPSKKRKGNMPAPKPHVIQSFFHLFDDLKHESEDGEFSQVIESAKEEERKMHFKILMGFINELVDNSISFFDETIPNRAAMTSTYQLDNDMQNMELDDGGSDVSNESSEDDIVEIEEVPQHLQAPPDCTAQ
ncbi:hypothetical protein EIN_379380 [Entamoeba invadens IP1]|uniref:Nucleosome assembly protein n=1 Tax=Entamoeba invadens IP1 TaxID=370355 RepID=A0A0A1UE73_ENTIV|nr:hypothetical protein EIN_379380 [Entamoeba invadens IP1]ELP92071.1 hypothetical protein EIN_379380 [Entamoeba invadens IP1]|eukprot:XP_004258842.1 hypothetical protein EIN_379380 [Entamoeba invadens IP1]